MSRKPRRRSPKSLAFALEPLEARWVMAASLSLTGPSDVVYEGQQAQLTLTLSERSRLPEAVEIRTTAASATQGYDYIHHTRRVTFFPGETSKTISISTLRDAGRELVEGIETFQVIATPVNSALGTRTATVKIADYVPPPAFEITFNYDDTVKEEHKAPFEWAAAHISSIIVGDLPDVIFKGEKIDDFQLNVSLQDLDAEGWNGYAQALEFRPGVGGLPFLGETVININIINNPGTKYTIAHEIVHALGFYQEFWEPLGLFDDAGGDPRFLGPNALREYRRIFGVQDAGVPLYEFPPPGSYGSHWRNSVFGGFGSELMVSGANTASTAIRPTSTITIGAMEDIGYEVNYAAADPFFPPAVQQPVQNIPANPPAQLNESTGLLSAATNAIVAPNSLVTAGGGGPSPSSPSLAAAEPVVKSPKPLLAALPASASKSPSIAPTLDSVTSQARSPRKLPTRLTFPDRAPIILVDELREAVATSLSTTDGPINLRGISDGQRSMLFAWAAYGRATSPDLLSAIASESSDTRRLTYGPVLVG